MTSSGEPNPVRVLVAPRAMSAEIVLGPVDDPSRITPEQCAGAVEAAGVERSRAVADALDRALADLGPGEELRREIARGVEPRHARDGGIVWDVPDAEPDASGAEAEGGETDHYTRSVFITVNEGQRLGRIVPPTEPEDGRDVRGGTVAAKRGRRAKLVLDESITLGEDGTMTAARDGVLRRSVARATVRDYLEIPGHVDFSTGHIDFPGDVEVMLGVRDLFRVAVGGALAVHGLIEAADIRVGGELTAYGGIAARERGRVRVEGDMTTRYLDGASVEVGGTLRVSREIVNSTLEVHGAVESPNATVLGGCLDCVGHVAVAALGSPAHPATTIALGAVPNLESRLREFSALADTLRARRDGAADPGVREAFDERLSRCEGARSELRERIAGLRTIDVRVSRVVHPGVRFTVGAKVYEVRDELRGPVRVTDDRSGALVYRVGDAPPVALAGVAEVTVWDAA